MQALKSGLENLNFPDWDIFEFITKKNGRRGPSKQECIQYYNQKSVLIQTFEPKLFLLTFIGVK